MDKSPTLSKHRTRNPLPWWFLPLSRLRRVTILSPVRLGFVCGGLVVCCFALLYGTHLPLVGVAGLWAPPADPAAAPAPRRPAPRPPSRSSSLASRASLRLRCFDVDDATDLSIAGNNNWQGG